MHNNNHIFEDDDIILTDRFLSDESDQNENDEIEKKKYIKQNKQNIENISNDSSVLSNHHFNKNVGMKRNNSIFNNEENKNKKYLTNNYHMEHKNISSLKDNSNEFNCNKNNYSNTRYDNNVTGNYFDFDNYYISNIDNTNNRENEIFKYDEKNIEIDGKYKKNNKRLKRSTRVWHDSDDDVDDKNENLDSTGNYLNEDNLHSDDSNEFNYLDEKEDENLIKNKEAHDNIFEEYIDENVHMENFSLNNNEGAISQIQADDIYIFDDEKIDMHIQKKKKWNKKNDNNIFLKYFLQKFTMHQIEDKKLKQLVCLPKSNLIFPVYNLNLYMLKYEDNSLNISKKISFKRKIKYVQEYKDNLYILSYDNFLRNYNLEKGVVYKNRIHYDKLDISLPREIKFVDKNTDDENNTSSSYLFSLSFQNSGKINVYDSRSYDIVKTFEMTNKYVGMNFHKKSNSLFALDEKGYLYNWCLNTNKLINKLVDNYSIFPSCLNIYNDYLVTGSCNGFLNLFDINNLNTPIKSFKNLTLRVHDIIYNPSHNMLLYYTDIMKNGIKLIDLKTKYVYCNVPWFNINVKYNIYAANFFNNGNNLCFAVSNNSFYVYNIY
ncbi:hypothetical protein PGSY75_1224400 [Plasmodium gaboni]|uniref:WD repeat-containing protein n=1 Tax=Plasmodium gaboni TaxID=647221 RepID=A0A151LGP7_9APIC|nr:hypothetical protein PGSY75_1224400 [Plasmodium gaboni]KYN98047.1 hypothetical protein PGSY75_1224400 [Plasmodium gaboni]